MELHGGDPDLYYGLDVDLVGDNDGGLGEAVVQDHEDFIDDDMERGRAGEEDFERSAVTQADQGRAKGQGQQRILLESLESQQPWAAQQRSTRIWAISPSTSNPRSKPGGRRCREPRTRCSWRRREGSKFLSEQRPLTSRTRQALSIPSLAPSVILLLFVPFQEYFISCLIVFLTMFASEWRVKYCDYKQLKKVVKRIKTQILHTKNQQHKVFDPNVFSVDKSKLENLLQNPSAILSSCCEQSISSETSMDVVHKTRIGDDEDFYETELFGTRSDHEKSFFFGLDDQLNKVDKFFRCKEDEYDAQARQLHIQMEEVIAMQELEGEPGNKGKVQRAAKILQTAFVEFYRGHRLLRNFSSLNMMAFVKIRKKYDKVTGVWQLPQDGRKLSLCNVGQGSKVYGPRRESVHSAFYERQPKASHGISQAHTLCEQSWKYKLYPG
ncbi:hypothetical protein SELMODRAFT_444431 [Selaginella moellendorffii]|uniref:SPX domain-containing protein n=1 Tax=Selaginella moellendorffii TaxID=88036 RepID=D8S9Z2_SELML|nr:hypothetical protein SELMODRAFT_444431 [Selaginella moellendorffii]